MDFLKTASVLRGLQNPVNSVRLVGQGEMDNYFMTESEQKMSLKKFRDGKGSYHGHRNGGPKFSKKLV